MIRSDKRKERETREKLLREMPTPREQPALFPLRDATWNPYPFRDINSPTYEGPPILPWYGNSGRHQ